MSTAGTAMTMLILILFLVNIYKKKTYDNKTKQNKKVIPCGKYNNCLLLSFIIQCFWPYSEQLFHPEFCLSRLYVSFFILDLSIPITCISLRPWPSELKWISMENSFFVLILERCSIIRSFSRLLRTLFYPLRTLFYHNPCRQWHRPHCLTHSQHGM